MLKLLLKKEGVRDLLKLHGTVTGGLIEYEKVLFPHAQYDWHYERAEWDEKIRQLGNKDIRAILYEGDHHAAVRGDKLNDPSFSVLIDTVLYVLSTQNDGTGHSEKPCQVFSVQGMDIPIYLETITQVFLPIHPAHHFHRSL